MVNLKLLIAYDGGNFLGWQKTEMGRSVEETLERALRLITQEEIVLQAASRTDSGVHALGQVVSVKLQNLRFPLERLKLSLNQLLPKEIAVLSIEEATSSFHPTQEATAKEYHYLIDTESVQMPLERERAWHFFYPIDLEKMKEAAKFLTGRHDFAAFCNRRKNDPYEETVRELTSIHIEKKEGRITIKIVGNRFLFRMARNIAGTLAFVGRGEIAPSAISEILASLDRKRAGPTAPSHGLYLVKVFY